MSKILKIGIIGGGRIGECHLKAYKFMDNIEVTGVAEIAPERRRYIEKVYGVKVFENFEELLEYSPNIVSVCTPDYFHVEPCIKSAKVGAHILCEKPLATTIEDAEKIIDSCKKYGVYLSVGFKFRYEKIYQETYKLLRDELIGKPLSLYIARPQEVSDIMSRWPTQVSVDISNICHEIDLAYWFLESEPTYVYAQYNRDWTKSETPTRVALLLQHDNNAYSLLYNSIHPEFPHVGGTYDAKFHIIGEKGYILGERPNKLEVCINSVPSIHTYNVELKNYYQEAFNREIAAFVKNIRLDREPEVKGEDALRTLKVIDAARKSFNMGKKIKIE
ncbi:MAG: Gfo/Idh/MocA family oxidoreductase [Nitrososphaeria archaeon]